jgi:leader peptidase (prepilin peptidase)/N-methyltransferase
MIELSGFSEGWINALVVFSGLVIGSFMNVVVARLPHRKDLVWTRSHCPKCKAQVAWYDNLPVLSYLFLRGRCRSCQTRISLRYPVIELLTALLFLAAKQRFGLSWVLVVRDWPFLAALVAVTFIDLEHRLIPDRITFPGVALGLLTSAWVPGLGLVQSLLGALFGFGFFYSVAWLYQWRSGKSGLGGGDIKFLAMLGAFLGPLGVFTTVLVSSVAGSVAGIAWAKLQGQGRLLKASIPFGPFLVLGALYYYLIGELLWLPFTEPM